MNTLARTTVAAAACLSIAGSGLAAERPGAHQPMHGLSRGGGPRMEQRDEPSRESMLARFVTNTNVAKKLGLSDKQVELLKSKSIELRKAAIRLKADQELAAMEQVELLAAPDLDEQALMAAVENTGRIRTEIAKLQIQPIILLKQTLTSEQLAQAKRMLHERMRKQRTRERPQGSGRGQDGPGWQPRSKEGRADWREMRQHERRNPYGDAGPQGPPPDAPPPGDDEPGQE